MCAEMYNACLDSWRGTYKWWVERHNPEIEKFPKDRNYSKYDLFKMLNGVRKDHPEWERLSVEVGRGVITRWDRTKEAYFKRCREGEKPGYPRFKPAHRWRSLELPNPKKSMIVPPNTVKNQSAKWWRLQVKGLPRLRFADQNNRLATALEGGGKLVELRVVRSPLRTEVHVVVKHPPRPLPQKKPVRPVGIDRGLNTRMALSDGTLVAPRNPDQAKIKRFQRLLYRSKKGSNSRKKKIRLVAKAYRRQKERAIQSDFRLAHRLTTEYDAFAVEVLDIAEMRRRPWVSKGFQKQRLADLARILEYKACKAGLQYRRVDAEGTSSTCSSCAHEQSTPQHVFACRRVWAETGQRRQRRQEHRRPGIPRGRVGRTSRRDAPLPNIRHQDSPPLTGAARQADIAEQYTKQLTNRQLRYISPFRKGDDVEYLIAGPPLFQMTCPNSRHKTES